MPIDVTPNMQQLWRRHVAECFPYLPPWTRAWFANAPFLVTMLRTQWPYHPPEQQAMIRPRTPPAPNPKATSGVSE